MSMKVVLVAAASVMAVSPALAMSKSQIVHHTGGPIPYSQLASMDKSGYNARSHKSKKAVAADQSVAANTTTTTAPADQSAAPAAPTPSAAPDANVTPSPAPAAPDAGQSPAAPPAAAPGSPGAAPQ